MPQLMIRTANDKMPLERRPFRPNSDLHRIHFDYGTFDERNLRLSALYPNLKYNTLRDAIDLETSLAQLGNAILGLQLSANRLSQRDGRIREHIGPLLRDVDHIEDLVYRAKHSADLLTSAAGSLATDLSEVSAKIQERVSYMRRIGRAQYVVVAEETFESIDNIVSSHRADVPVYNPSPVYIPRPQASTSPPMFTGPPVSISPQPFTSPLYNPTSPPYDPSPTPSPANLPIAENLA